MEKRTFVKGCTEKTGEDEMTLKLSEVEKLYEPYHAIDTGHPLWHTAKLISWAKRARAYLEKELPHAKSSLERFESTLGHNKVAQETVIPRLKKDIAELEQLLGEVEP